MSAMDVSALTGEWMNTNRETAGIRRAVVVADGERIGLRVFGTGSRTPEDWGEVSCLPCSVEPGGGKAVAFSARYDLGELRVDLSVNYAKGILVLAACQHAERAAGDPPRSWFTREFFYRKLS